MWPTGWSSTLKDWERLRDSCGKLNWRRIELRGGNHDSVPAKPGVYLICAGLKDKPKDKAFGPKWLFNPLYIGRTGNLKERFKTHCKKSHNRRVEEYKECFTGLDFALDFVFAVCADSYYLEDILIDCFGPSANGKSGEKMVIRARVNTQAAVKLAQ